MGHVVLELYLILKQTCAILELDRNKVTCRFPRLKVQIQAIGAKTRSPPRP